MTEFINMNEYLADDACETNHSLVRMESCWKEDSLNSSVALFAAISQVSTWYLCASGCCVGVMEKVVRLKLD